MRKLFPTISKDFGVRLKALMYFNNITTSMELAVKPVSYTHLDVYKRQPYHLPG